MRKYLGIPAKRVFLVFNISAFMLWVQLKVAPGMAASTFGEDVIFLFCKLWEKVEYLDQFYNADGLLIADFV